MRMKVIRIIIIVSLILVIGGSYIFQRLRLEGQRMLSEDPRVWEDIIAEFEQRDQLNPPPVGAILFVGSSSIRFWHSLEKDMLPLKVFGRGFGGAKIVDVSYYVSRIVAPYQPTAVVLYIGSNDFSELFGNRAKTLAQAKPLYSQLIDRLKQAVPDAQIFIVALKPTSRNWQQWPLLQRVNQYLASLAENNSSVFYIDANSVLFTEQGVLNKELLLFDGVHMNDRGYRVWGAEIKQLLLDKIH